MAFQKGHTKAGGRQKGTPNKTASPVREAISKMLDQYYNSETFTTDIEALEPRDRVAAMERLAAYAVPKLQTINLDAVVEQKETIEDRLAKLSGED
jgi:hypothetical protein